MPFFNLFCLLDIFSAFYYLICFLIFCLAFWLDRSFVNRYFAILIRFQFLVLPCFLSLNSWGRAASSECTIAIIVCMFCGPIVLAHGCYMTRELRREMHFSAFCKLAEKYFLVGMNSLGTLRRVYCEWLYANSSSWCSLEATHFYFSYLLFYLFIYLFLYYYFFFSDSVIIFVVIEIFLLDLFCPRLDWEYLCLELLGVLGQIDDCFNGFSQNPSFGQIGF